MNRTMNKKLLKLIFAALFAALICVSTMVIQIPSPMNGYVNLGDCFVLISGWLLGPLYGFFSAGLGSAMADIFTGYAHYAPGTFVIKGLVAVVGAVIPMCLMPSHRKIGRIIGSVSGEIVMVAGYFGYACLLLGKGLAAASSIPGNLVQGVVGAAAAIILIEILERSKISDKLVNSLN